MFDQDYLFFQENGQPPQLVAPAIVVAIHGFEKSNDKGDVYLHVCLSGTFRPLLAPADPDHGPSGINGGYCPH